MPLMLTAYVVWLILFLPSYASSFLIAGGVVTRPAVFLYKDRDRKSNCAAGGAHRARCRRQHFSLFNHKGDETIDGYYATTKSTTAEGDGDLISESFRMRYGASSSAGAALLPEWLLAKCEDCEWTHPTRIQEKVLDAVLLDDSKTTDAIVQAETGSGKTLAYLLPCLAGIDASRSSVQALIVVPTRELGLQVARVAKRLASASATTPDDDDKEASTTSRTSSMTTPTTSGNNKIMVMSVLQGSQNRRQRAWAWAEPPHLVIGTPRELCAMIRHGGIKRYNSVKFLVVDEVDACLLNNNGPVSSSSSPSLGSSLSSSGTPLHELLSKYLSPTYDDGKQDSALLSLDGYTSASTTITTTTRNGKPRPLSQQRKTIFCSATIPQHRHFVKQCVQNQWMLQKPLHICLRPGEQLLPSQLEHAYIVCSTTEKKLAALRRILKKIMLSSRDDDDDHDDSTVSKKKILIFAENHRPLEEIAKVLADDSNGIYWNEQTAALLDTARQQQQQQQQQPYKAVVSVLRYEDSLSQRAAAMDAFRGEHDADNSNNNGPLLRVMLSTDLAARGLDIVDITHVIHLDLPATASTYVHRAGRTGRFGRPGQVLSIITPQQEFVLRRLTNKLSVDITCIARQQQQVNDSKPLKG